MALLSAGDQAEIKKIFEQLTSDVRLLFFTQRESALYIPGREECATCKDTRALLEEVAALSDKLHLEIHEISPGDEVAREHGIERVPALVMTADGVKGKVRYFGLPSGYEFSVLLGSLDAQEMHGSLGIPAEQLAVRTDRALTLIETALLPPVAATLRAVA